MEAARFRDIYNRIRPHQSLGDRTPRAVAVTGPLPGSQLSLSDSAARLRGMTFVNAGTLGTLAGHRDELVATLTQSNDLLRGLGCLSYEVGVSDDEPDTVFVVEMWESGDAHRRSLEHPEVQAAIAAARPILSGEFGGFRFEVVGSPLRSE